MIIPPRAIFTGDPRCWPVIGLSDREILDPEGIGVDLRLDKVHVISGGGELLVETRRTSNSNSVDTDDAGCYTFMPGNWYLVTTVESMNLPANLAASIFPRSTLFRSGIALHSSVVPPGYTGTLTLGLSVGGGNGFVMQRFSRFCHLVLAAVADGATAYRGQWQGGRVSQPLSERQK
ncbi:dCTP deaminase [Stenotrophomonas geniculata]|uniref:dCTP deaminase n=1 Tax=Stenotrophomonas geniculata TaxID=86188 RepID=UPI003CE4CA99